MARVCALKRLCSQSSADGFSAEEVSTAVREGLRGILLGEGLVGPGNGREVERLLAYELLSRAEGDGGDGKTGAGEVVSGEEAEALSPDLLGLLELRWSARGRYRYGLAPVAALMARWVSNGHLVARSAVSFAVRAACQHLCEEDGAEEEARLSQLGRCGCGLLLGEVEENRAVLLELLRACALDQDARAQSVALEILSFLCGKDSDLGEVCADSVSARFPVEQIWLLMADAASEAGSYATPWHWWVIPLLRKPGAPSTLLIDACGFVASCASSQVLAAGKALLCRELLDALRELSTTSASEEVRRFADATGRRAFKASFPNGAPG